MSTMPMVLLALMGVLLVLYLMRRRSRVNREN